MTPTGPPGRVSDPNAPPPMETVTTDRPPYTGQPPYTGTQPLQPPNPATTPVATVPTPQGNAAISVGQLASALGGSGLGGGGGRGGGDLQLEAGGGATIPNIYTDPQQIVLQLRRRAAAGDTSAQQQLDLLAWMLDPRNAMG